MYPSREFDLRKLNHPLIDQVHRLKQRTSVVESQNAVSAMFRGRQNQKPGLDAKSPTVCLVRRFLL